MSYRCDFRCPTCSQPFTVQAISEELPAATNGAHPQDVASAPAPPPADRTPSPARRRADQSFAEKRADQQHRERAADRRAAVKAEKVCPVHGVARPSRFGGLYCPQPAETESGWCSWSPTKEGAAA